MLDIIQLIESARLDLSDEKRLQTDLAAVLAGAGIQFTRERVLSARDTPDFLTSDGIVIECKLRPAQKTAVYRQLQRYASHTEVATIILATNLSMALPATIHDKPAYISSLSKGWL
ncbi:MAG: PDDEXK family nuclease [Acidithiobacillus sp.]